MTAPDRARRIVGWLNDLSRFTSNNPADGELARRITDYAAMLVEAFDDDAAFTHQSLKHVIGQCRFFPSYAELSQTLGAWWKDNRPPVPALPPPAPPPPPPPRTPEELAAVAELVRQFKANVTMPEEAAPPSWWLTYDHKTAGHLSDGQLIAAYERLAAEGNHAAMTRLVMLKKKIAGNSED